MSVPFVSTFVRIKSPKHLNSLLTGIRANISNRILLYSVGLSPKLDANAIEEVVKDLTKSARTSLGCLTSRFPSSASARRNLDDDGFSLALASFDEASCIPFSSSEVDSDAIQVGRWHTTARRDAVADMDLPWTATAGDLGRELGGKEYWEDAWSRRTHVATPSELEGVKPE